MEATMIHCMSISSLAKFSCIQYHVLYSDESLFRPDPVAFEYHEIETQVSVSISVNVADVQEPPSTTLMLLTPLVGAFMISIPTTYGDSNECMKYKRGAPAKEVFLTGRTTVALKQI